MQGKYLLSTHFATRNRRIGLRAWFALVRTLDVGNGLVGTMESYYAWCWSHAALTLGSVIGFEAALFSPAGTCGPPFPRIEATVACQLESTVAIRS